MKKLIKDIKMGKNLEENIKLFINELAGLYYQNALLNSVFNYCTVYEKAQEIKPETRFVMDELLPYIQEGVKSLISGQAMTQAMEGIDMARNNNIKRMDVLTVYTDMLQIYEYVLNRVELRFTEEVSRPLENEEEFSKSLARFIFSINDNIVINENIKQVLEQLPVRMTKQRFFELLRNSLSIYKGGGRDSAESYLYMLRTGAMLYKPEGMEEYFPEFLEILKEFKEADYSNLTKDEFLRLRDDMTAMAEKLFALTDMYVLVQELLNNLYTCLLCGTIGDIPEFKEKETAYGLIKMVYEELEKDENSRTLSLDSLEQILMNMEGHMESLLPQIYGAEGTLEEIKDRTDPETVSAVNKIQKLMSSSFFAALSEEADTRTADDEYIRKACDQLIEELTGLFKDNHQMVKRAVIAATISKLPVFFTSPDEVMEYIKGSLGQCRDYAEKRGSMSLLYEIMNA